MVSSPSPGRVGEGGATEGTPDVAGRDEAGPILNGLPTNMPDIDPEETAEWLESLEGVAETAGRRRARYLMLELLQRSRQLGVGVPSLTATDYVNTIPPEREPWFPGDEDVERRYRALLRWNSAMVVHRAQRPGHRRRWPHLLVRLVVHALRGGLQPLLPGSGRPGRRRPGLHPGARLPRRVRAGLPRGAAVRAPARRVPAGAVAPGRRPAVLPAPSAGARLLAVPHRVDGPRPDERHLPGAVQQVPAEPRDQGHLRPARVGVPRRRRDGRAGEPRPAPGRRERGARQPHVRHQLQPAAARRSGARQRQDHPGARVVLPRRRLERHQGRVGPRVGRAAGQGLRTARSST